MSEFKINSDFTTEVEDLGISAGALNLFYYDIELPEVNTLNTANKIIAQNRAIKEVIELYKELLNKDVGDVKAFIAEAEKLDDSTAMKFSSTYAK